MRRSTSAAVRDPPQHLHLGQVSLPLVAGQRTSPPVRMTYSSDENESLCTCPLNSASFCCGDIRNDMKCLLGKQWHSYSLFCDLLNLVVKYRPSLGIGATAARHALDVEIGVRIPDPQLDDEQKQNSRIAGVLFLLPGRCMVTSNLSRGRIHEAHYPRDGSVTFQIGSRSISSTTIAPSARPGMPIPKDRIILAGITIAIMKKLSAWLLSACR